MRLFKLAFDYFRYFSLTSPLFRLLGITVALTLFFGWLIYLLWPVAAYAFPRLVAEGYIEPRITYGMGVSIFLLGRMLFSAGRTKK